jgi:hypothetical protein
MWKGCRLCIDERRERSREARIGEESQHEFWWSMCDIFVHWGATYFCLDCFALRSDPADRTFMGYATSIPSSPILMPSRVRSVAGLGLVVNNAAPLGVL